MSRSGYVDDYDDLLQLYRYRGAVLSAIRGKRGQAFLYELIAALDALPHKRLIANQFEEGSEVCALGCVGRARGLDMTSVDTYDDCNCEDLARTFSIAESMVREIMFQNDEGGLTAGKETQEERWTRMHKWAQSQLVKP